MTDHEKQNLKGQVRTLRESVIRESIIPPWDGTEEVDLIMVFDEDGNVTERCARQFDGSMQSGPQFRFFRLERASRQGERPKVHPARVEVISDLQQGQKKTIYFLPQVERQQATSPLSFRDTAGTPVIAGEAAVTITSIEDAAGNEIELVSHDAEHILLMRGVRTFDEQGRPREETFYAGDFTRKAKYWDCDPVLEETQAELAAEFPYGSEIVRTIYQYDENGRLAELLEFRPSMRPFRMGYLYDDQGNELEITSIGEGRNSKIHYEYEYDPHGNWTKRIEIRDDSWPVTTLRTIDYY